MSRGNLVNKVVRTTLVGLILGTMFAGWVGIASTSAAPAAPTITSPGSSTGPGPTLSTLTPTLQWNAVSGAYYYAIAISRYPYGSSNIIYNPQQVYGTSHTVPSGTLVLGERYRWNMQAYGSGGWSAISNTLYFQTCTYPAAPTITSPGSITGPGPTVSLTPTLQWTAVSGADYYALAISKYPYGSSNIIYNPQQVYGTSHTVPSGTLVLGERYRWNMQAHGCGGWSGISNTLYFQTVPPTISASINSYSPSSKITVCKGVSFTLRAWFTNTGSTGAYFYPGVSIWNSSGTLVYDQWGSKTYLSVGQQGSASWSASLSTTGEYWLQFGVWNEARSQLLDKKPSPSQNLIKIIDCTSGRIDSYSPSSKIEVNPVQSFTLQMWFTNTGGIGTYFYPGVSIWNSSGALVFDQWGSKTYLGAGQQGSASWSTSLSTAGEYWLQFGLWNETRSQLLDKEPSPSQNLIKIVGGNTEPQLFTGYVDPTTGTTSTNFYYYVSYYDADGDSPSTKYAYVDGSAYSMNLYSGSASNGVYRYGPRNLATGSHTYYFYFEDGRGGTDRLPTSVSYSGPTVSQLDNPPIADFSADVTNCCEPLTVQFIDQSMAGDNSITSWYWDFGDGDTSTTQNPSHTYFMAGHFTVALTVIDSRGYSDTETKTDYIISNASPLAAFSADVCSSCEPLTVQFTDESIDGDNPIISWYWDFGDGDTSTNQNPSHTYNDAGTYTVYLTVTDSHGCSDTEVKALTIDSLDSTAPNISIIFPYNGQTFTTSTVTLSGTASDNVGINKVEVKVGAGSWQLASGTTSWTNQVTLSPGSNTIYARATDTSGNTKETSVTVAYSSTGAGHIILIEPLQITPAGPYFVGNTLKATFGVKNVGNAAITLKELLVGGRYNSWELPDDGFPDFTCQTITLQPGDTHSYEGGFTIPEPGNYRFFVAYYIENPTPDEKELLDENNWNTCVELGEALTETDRVKEVAVFQECETPEELAELSEAIDRGVDRHLQYQYPSYLLDVDSFTSAVATVWTDWTSFITRTDLREKYEELYHTGIEYQWLAFQALMNADRFLKSGNTESSRESLQRSYEYEKASAMSFTAAAEFFDGSLAAGEILAEGIKDACETAVTLGVAIVCPAAAPKVDAIYMAIDYAITAKVEGLGEATKDLIIELIAKAILKDIKFTSLDYNTVETYVNGVSTEVCLDTLLANKEFMTEFGFELHRVIVDRIIDELGVYISETIIEKAIECAVDDLQYLVRSVQAKVKSPVELTVCDSKGQITGLTNKTVRHEIPMSLYYNGTIEVFFPTDSYQYDVIGTDVGTYGLEITSVQGDEAAMFTAADISITADAVHHYTVDWDALSQGEGGVTIYVDSNGDGIIDEILRMGGNSSLGCFIATAAYGSPMAEEIQVLHEFRDEYLLTNPLGRAFVDFYYEVSPAIAELITEHPSLKPIVRFGLLPAVAISTVFVKTTPTEKAVIVSLAAVSVVLTIWATRRRRRGMDSA